MCFGPSQAEIDAAQAARDEANREKRRQVEERAEQKRRDIATLVDSRDVQAGRQGATGRRSLMTAPTAGGYATRYGR
jgi:hypothetical protein